MPSDSYSNCSFKCPALCIWKCKYIRQAKTDAKVFGTFFHAMLERGVYLAPSIFEAGFVSAAHTDADIDATIAAARESFKLL